MRQYDLSWNLKSFVSYSILSDLILYRMISRYAMDDSEDKHHYESSSSLDKFGFSKGIIFEKKTLSDLQLYYNQLY